MPFRIAPCLADLKRIGARIAVAALLAAAAAGCTSAQLADSGRGPAHAKTAASTPIIGVGY